jgi:hypothetical protein
MRSKYYKTRGKRLTSAQLRNSELRVSFPMQPVDMKRFKKMLRGGLRCRKNLESCARNFGSAPLGEGGSRPLPGPRFPGGTCSGDLGQLAALGSARQAEPTVDPLGEGPAGHDDAPGDPGFPALQQTCTS